MAGGVIAYPTEAVYGLGCLPLHGEAVRRLLAIKQRGWDKGFIVVAADFEQLEALVDRPAGPVAADILASWPGPVTWLLPAKPWLPGWLTGGRDTLAVRVSAHPLVRALCRRAGRALISSSANISRRPPLKRLLLVRRDFGASVDYILPGALGDAALPTTIRDGRTGRVLRAG